MVSKHMLIMALAANLVTLTGCSTNTGAPSPNSSAGSPAVAPATESSVVAAKSTGVELYQQYCSGCHGAQGQGVPKAGVALVEEAGEEAAELRATILNGKGKMPGFKGRVNEEQLTAIIEHLRTFAHSEREERGDHESESHG